MAVVTAQGNPGLPFYFLFTESNGHYRLSGEGTGLPQVSSKAYEDLARLSQQDIPGAGEASPEGGPATQPVNALAERTDAPSPASDPTTARVATAGPAGQYLQRAAQLFERLNVEKFAAAP